MALVNGSSVGIKLAPAQSGAAEALLALQALRGIRAPSWARRNARSDRIRRPKGYAVEEAEVRSFVLKLRPQIVSILSSILSNF